MSMRRARACACPTRVCACCSYKNGEQIKEERTGPAAVKIERGAGDAGYYELVIPTVGAADAGTYSCTASNSAGSASSEARVSVTESKRLFEGLLAAPERSGLQPGHQPTFYWRRDGKPFEPEERFKVLLGDNEDSLALVFQHVRPEDAGLYTCVASTSSGHISCSAELTVHGETRLLIPPSSVLHLTISLSLSLSLAHIEFLCR